MGVYSGTEINEEGLVLCLDAANPRSYGGSGTTWSDLSSNGNNGTLVNGPTYNVDNLGNIVFDGGNDRVDLGYKQSLLPPDITQEAWVNASNFVNWHGIISNMPGWGTGFSLQIGINQGIAAMVSGAYLRTSYIPTINTWYHIVATHRSSDDFNALYVNGVLENSFTRSITYSQNAVTKIGVFYTYNTLFFPGKINQIRTYNRALSAQEVEQNFKATRGRFGL